MFPDQPKMSLAHPILMHNDRAPRSSRPAFPLI
jgi:hypothetical protein